MDIYQERIKPLFDSKNLSDTQLEKEIGLPRGKIYLWNNGKFNSYIKYIDKIAAYFDVSADYLLGKSDIKKAPAFDMDEWIAKNAIAAGEFINIPVYGSVKAGNGGCAVQEFLGFEPVSRESIVSGDVYFWLKVVGDSYEKELLEEQHYKEDDEDLIKLLKYKKACK